MSLTSRGDLKVTEGHKVLEFIQVTDIQNSICECKDGCDAISLGSSLIPGRQAGLIHI